LTASIKKLGRISNIRSYRRQLDYRALFDPRLPSTAIYLQPLVTIRLFTSFPPICSAKEKPQKKFRRLSATVSPLHSSTTRIVPFKYNYSRTPTSTWSSHNCYATLILYPKHCGLSAYLAPARALMCSANYCFYPRVDARRIIIKQTNKPLRSAGSTPVLH